MRANAATGARAAPPCRNIELPAIGVTPARAAPFVARALRQRHLQRDERHGTTHGCCSAPEVSAQSTNCYAWCRSHRALRATQLRASAAPCKGRGDGGPAAGCAHRVREASRCDWRENKHAKWAATTVLWCASLAKDSLVAPRLGPRARTSAAPSPPSASLLTRASAARRRRRGGASAQQGSCTRKAVRRQA